MNSFFTINKKLVTYSLILLIIIPIFGFNFLISFVGNILLLLILIPLLLLIIAFISFNSFKSRLNVCSKCGNVSLGINRICTNCGANLNDINMSVDQQINNPSETTIEVKAEEIK